MFAMSRSKRFDLRRPARPLDDYVVVVAGELLEGPVYDLLQSIDAAVVLLRRPVGDGTPKTITWLVLSPFGLRRIGFTNSLARSPPPSLDRLAIPISFPLR
jgi:hypothetical protein